jgi:uncharacterized protein (UPF0335 family)
MTLEEFKDIMERRGEIRKIAEEKIQVILNMSKKGFDVTTISDCVNISEERIKKILENN